MLRSSAALLGLGASVSRPLLSPRPCSWPRPCQLLAVLAVGGRQVDAHRLEIGAAGAADLVPFATLDQDKRTRAQGIALAVDNGLANSRYYEQPLIRAAVTVVDATLVSARRNDHLGGLGPTVADRDPKAAAKAQGVVPHRCPPCLRLAVGRQGPPSAPQHGCRAGALMLKSLCAGKSFSTAAWAASAAAALVGAVGNLDHEHGAELGVPQPNGAAVGRDQFVGNGKAEAGAALAG